MNYCEGCGKQAQLKWVETDTGEWGLCPRCQKKEA